MRTTDFDEFYRVFWGERWPALKRSLTGTEFQVARRNFHSDVSSESLVPTGVLGLAGCFEVTPALRAEIPRGSEGLLGYYIQDPASIWIARQLGVESGDRVLDMCAAPGGKTLVLIEALSAEGEILANEPSPARRERLMKVIQQYVPRDVRERVRVTGKDGGLFSKSHAESFDRVLVDAPCSGEKHLLQSPGELANWSSSRSERLAQGQYALLSGALEALRPGGALVYSTCSVSGLENDGVVGRLLKKKKDKVELAPMTVPAEGEATEFGVIFLPDRAGFGPLFASALRKR